MTPPPLLPMLPDELLEEIFLRLPPDEPAWLVRASLASKLCLGRLSAPRFHARYREFHGAPPMLGFFYSRSPCSDSLETEPLFLPTTKFSACISDQGWRSGCNALDCRHGRVVLADACAGFRKLAVWDPMTGCRRELEAPDDSLTLGAAVLCAVSGCDHRACHEGPFRVLLFGLRFNGGAASVHTWVCSSESEQWSEPCSRLRLGPGEALIMPRPFLLFENALHHMVYYGHHIAVLKYDLGSNSMSMLDGPPLAGSVSHHCPILMTMWDATTGFAYLDCLTFYLWSRQIRSDGVATWSQRIVLDLKEILPIQDPNIEFWLIGFKEESGIIFVTSDLGTYEINLQSLEWKKLWKREKICALVPYKSFYNPPERATTPCKAAH